MGRGAPPHHGGKRLHGQKVGNRSKIGWQKTGGEKYIAKKHKYHVDYSRGRRRVFVVAGQRSDGIAEIEKHGAPLYTVQGTWSDFRKEYRRGPLAASRGAWLFLGRAAIGSNAIYYQMNALPFWQYSACSITLEFGRRNNKYAFDRYRWHLFDFSSNGEINLPDDAQKITLGEYAEYRVKSLIIGQAGLVSDPKSVQTNIEPGRAYVVVSGQK